MVFTLAHYYTHKTFGQLLFTSPSHRALLSSSCQVQQTTKVLEEAEVFRLVRTSQTPKDPNRSPRRSY